MNGVSEIIATVVVLSAALMLAIGVSYIISSLPQQYTRLEILASSASYGDPRIIVNLRNVGGREISVVDIHLNDMPVSVLIGDSVESIDPDIYEEPLQVSPGESREITIDLNPSSWTGGETIQIMIVTSSGNKYYAMVTLT